MLPAVFTDNHHMLVEFFKLFIFIHSGHLLFRTLLTHCEPLYLLIRYKIVKSCTVFLSSIYAFHTFLCYTERTSTEKE